MVTATNVDASAVSTIGWLSASDATIVVPVYQRQYRWDIGGCEQLLADVRAVADADDHHRHFLGSILSTENTEHSDPELVLIDGQQRITTLMLLIAALHHTVKTDDPALAAQLEKVLLGPTRLTKLRPHRAWAGIFESIILERRLSSDEKRDSRFDDNYAFFRSQVRLSDAPRIWRGLQRLEHVAISLGANANAQQIFESLNSTGTPLLDHELIHNYLLMGLSHAQQNEIEDTFWVPIEQNTGEFIGSFWRHYLVMTTGREVTETGGRGVYDAFRQQFPHLDLDTLRTHASEWLEHSRMYRTLLDPSSAEDPEVGRQLAWTNTFGRGMYPLLMRSLHDFSHSAVDRGSLIGTLELIQSLLIRRAVVGLSSDGLVGRLCRARGNGVDELVRAAARIMPSDERVRIALKYAELPHAAYVLGRLAALDDPDGAGATGDFDVDHVVPLAPADNWTGDGVREWAALSEDEQNSHRALSPTLGNLALLEQPLAERGFGAPFPQKRATIYSSSDVPATRELADIPAWGTATISKRTVRLTKSFLGLWTRPEVSGIDDDGLTPILDAVHRRGWPRGWQREFEYVEYRGEHWEIYDVKSLFHRIFKRLWADSRVQVEAFSNRRGGPIFDAQAWNGEWEALDDSHHLYLGWDSQYMVSALQGVIAESDLAAEVFVKYSYIGDAM